MKLNMLPVFAPNDQCDIRPVAAELLSKLHVGVSSACVQFTYFQYLFTRQFGGWRIVAFAYCLWMRLGPVAIAARFSMLCDFIGLIFFMGAPFQVKGIYTLWKVTFVKNAKVFPLTVHQEQRKSMRTVMSVIQPDSAIAICLGISGPSPALAVRSIASCFIDKAKISLNVIVSKVGWDYIGFSHLNFLSGLVRVASVLKHLGDSKYSILNPVQVNQIEGVSYA